MSSACRADQSLTPLTGAWLSEAPSHMPNPSAPSPPACPQPYQVAVLDALAAWLDQEPPRQVVARGPTGVLRRH